MFYKQIIKEQNLGVDSGQNILPVNHDEFALVFSVLDIEPCA